MSFLSKYFFTCIKNKKSVEPEKFIFGKKYISLIPKNGYF